MKIIILGNDMSDKYKKLEHVPYVPNYKKMGITPYKSDLGKVNNSDFLARSKITDIKSNLKTDDDSSEFLHENDNPRIRNTNIAISKNVPYAEVSEMSPLKSSSIPNSGNNMERTWVSIDGDIIDDVGFDNVNSSSDNNINEEEYMTVSENELDPVENNDESNHIGDYVLMFNDKIISSGNLENIQQEVRALIFGEHDTYKEANVEDLVVLKKIPIKIGVFIDS